MSATDKITQLNIWKPIAYVGGLFAVLSLAYAGREMYKTHQTAKKKEEVEKGLEEVKEVLVAEVTEDFSGCGGCSGAAGDGGRQFPIKENYSLKSFSSANAQEVTPDKIYSGATGDGQFIRPDSLIPPVFS